MNEEDIADRLECHLQEDGGWSVGLYAVLEWFRSHANEARERHARFERVCEQVEGFDARLTEIEKSMKLLTEAALAQALMR